MFTSHTIYACTDSCKVCNTALCTILADTVTQFILKGEPYKLQNK